MSRRRIEIAVSLGLGDDGPAFMVPKKDKTRD
jgi:hypothetical protein